MANCRVNIFIKAKWKGKRRIKQTKSRAKNKNKIEIQKAKGAIGNMLDFYTKNATVIIILKLITLKSCGVFYLIFQWITLRTRGKSSILKLTIINETVPCFSATG